MRGVAVAALTAAGAAAPASFAADLAGPATGASAAAASEAPATDVPLHDCRLPGWPHAVRCGTLRRPLDPAAPGGVAIGIRYVVVPAVAQRASPTPLFFLAGGPGQSAIDLAPQVLPAFARLNNRRDIVFVDQRGTGGSAPLDCADDDPEGELAEAAASLDAQVAQLARCQAALRARPALAGPGALGFFTTSIAMDDLDAVRRTLGAERIDLVGVSYGTRAALEYLRRYPHAVRRVVLDSVAPPDMALPASLAVDAQAALDALFAACAGEPACRTAYPTLRADWQALLRRTPIAARVADPRTGRPEAATLTRERLTGIVRGALYSPAAAALLPAAIDAAAHGRFEPLVGLGAGFMPRRGPRLALGLHFSVVCAEDMPRVAAAADRSGDGRPGAHDDFGPVSATPYPRVCAAWPRGAVPPAFYAIPRTTAPVLLLSGGLDPATPPRHGQRVQAALGPTAQLVVVPNGGHGLLGVGCTPDLVFRFLDAEPAPAKLDVECLRRVPRPLAFLPVAPASSAARGAR